MKNKSNAKSPKIFSDLERCVTVIPIPVCWRDINNKILGGNDLAFRIVSTTDPSEIIIGKTPYDYYPKDIAEVIVKNIQHVIKENKSSTVEEQIIDIKTGRVRWFLTTRSSLLDDDGVKIIGVVESAIEITDSKAVEKLKIEKSQKVVSFTNLMIGSIVHELRIPFGAIISQMDSLKATFKQKGSLPVIEKDFWDVYGKIKGVVDMASLMISDMLFKLKIFSSEGLPKLTYDKLSISNVIKKFMKSFPFRSGEKELIRIIWGQDFNYIGDLRLTEHLLINLIKNAFDAIKNNKNKGDISIEIKSDNKNYNQLIIKDTGVGIPKELLSNIFNPLESKKSVDGGSGLGLVFCKAIMKSYGGTIICDSKLGEFTQVTLNFPKVLYNTKKIKAEIQ